MKVPKNDATLGTTPKRHPSDCGKHGARNVRVFGSTARGSATEDSDIDILVDLEEGRSLLDQVGLQQELEELPGRKVDVVVKGGISPYLEGRILSEAVPLWMMPRIYLSHVRDAIERIAAFTPGGREQFFADPMVQDAVIRNLEVIGEAVKELSEPLRSAHPG